MHPNEALVETFYRCFAKRDGDGMAACYAEDVVFSDPVFPELRGDRAGAMWRMLCERGTDLEVTAEAIAADDREGRARWIARYTFRKTGRRVVNDIRAEFRFRDGRIAQHVDDFSFWRWSRQALGPVGVALGWSPLVRNKVRAEGARALDAFLARPRRVAPISVTAA